MLQAAKDRLQANGLENIRVIRADARTLPVAPSSFDAAYAAMSVTAIQQSAVAIRNVKTALKPGGRFLLLDAIPFENWPWHLANRLVVPVAKFLHELGTRSRCNFDL